MVQLDFVVDKMIVDYDLLDENYDFKKNRREDFADNVKNLIVLLPSKWIHNKTKDIE